MVPFNRTHMTFDERSVITVRILYLFRDIWRYLSKIDNFTYRLYFIKIFCARKLQSIAPLFYDMTTRSARDGMTICNRNDNIAFCIVLVC